MKCLKFIVKIVTIISIVCLILCVFKLNSKNIKVTRANENGKIYDNSEISTGGEIIATCGECICKPVLKIYYPENGINSKGFYYLKDGLLRIKFNGKDSGISDVSFSISDNLTKEVLKSGSLKKNNKNEFVSSGDDCFKLYDINSYSYGGSYGKDTDESKDFNMLMGVFYLESFSKKIDIYISIRDVNGKEVSDKNTYLVDMDKPNLNVSYDNNNSYNDIYYNKKRTLNINIDEKDLNKNKVTLSINGEDVKFSNIYGIDSKENNGNTIYQTKYDFNEDGDYYISLICEDMAGNLSDTYSDHFIIDKTMPDIKVSGIENEKSYNDKIVPVIDFEDDNLDNKSMVVKLIGNKNGEIVLDNKMIGKNKITLDIFDFKSEIDDIYNLKLEAADLAGNRVDKSILFSINRFGSTYDYDDLKVLNHKYINKAKDIYFTEINVDEINLDNVKINVSKDASQMVALTKDDYSVIKNKDDKNWAKYTYIIKKEIFDEDGKYSISVTSRDKANNLNASNKGLSPMDIDFTLDTKKPSIVSLNDFSYRISDNFLVRDVRFFVNDKELEGEKLSKIKKIRSDVYDIEDLNISGNFKIRACDMAGNICEKEFVIDNKKDSKKGSIAPKDRDIHKSASVFNGLLKKEKIKNVGKVINKKINSGINKIKDIRIKVLICIILILLIFIVIAIKMRALKIKPSNFN